MGLKNFLSNFISGDEPRFDPFQEAVPLFKEVGIDLDSVLFSTYDDPILTENDSAIVLVGSGNVIDGKELGFVIEVIAGKGVVCDLLLEPSVLATHHEQAARVARKNGVSLMHAFKAMITAHSKKYGSIIDVQKGAGQESKDSGHTFEPGISGPAIFGGKPALRCNVGDFMGVISIENKSIPPIEYPYVMVVFRGESHSPILFITAENNSMASMFTGVLSDDDKEKFAGLSSGLFLGVFNGDGRRNLGKFEDIESLEGFAERASEVMCKELELSDEISIKFEEIL